MSFNQELRKIPFLRLLIPIIIGIIIGEYFAPTPETVWVTGSVCVAFLLLTYSIKSLRKNYQNSGWFGLTISGILITLGIGLVQKANEQMLLPQDFEDKCATIGFLDEPPLIKEKSVRCLVKLESYQKDTTWKNSDIKVMMYFKKDSLSEKLVTGDRILFTSQFKKVKNAGNPNEFDYANYLRHKHVYYQSYQNSSDWKYLGNGGGFVLKRLAMRWRRKLLDIYKQNNITDDAYGVISALTLGYKQEIDPETRDSWASAGAMHVLAVSGLHVGIIYLILNTLLGFLQRYRLGKIIRALLLLASLWFYATLTGLSPSVMRAAAMFSFIVVGQSLKRTSSVYNSLAVSAFFLLLADPFFFFSVGFQLSYLAVFSIVFFQPRIYKLLNFENTIADKAWGLTTVSLAAQIGTFPLGLYYFHQFPIYFLLTNLVVIPFAGIMIYLAGALFILSSLSWAAKTLAFLLKLGFDIMNGAIIWIKNLPGALLSNIYLDSFQLLGFYLAITSLTLFVILKRRYYLFAVIVVLILMQIPSLLTKYEQENQNKMIVYNIRKGTVLSWQRGGECVFLTDSLTDFESTKKWINSYLLSSGVDTVSHYLLEDTAALEFANIPLVGKQFFWMSGKRKVVVVRNHELAKVKLKQPIPVNYVVLGKNVRLFPNKLRSLFKTDSVILDGSNSEWYRNKWRDSTANNSLWLHDVQVNGAFVVY